MASDELVVAALGRPFTLGMLYDARADKLIPGVTLWDAKTRQENTAERPQPSSSFAVSTSDSTAEKSTLLDVDASLKVSFLGGLIEVGGSAKYLNDMKHSHHQSRVTLQYKATTKFKQMFLAPLDAKNKEQIGQIEQSLATHVVSGIVYGAQAFFVFDSEKSEDSSVQDIQGHMEAVIKKIPSFQIEGKVDIKLTDKEKALTDKFSCKFFGDFVLDVNPSTFVDAVKTYMDLPKLLGPDGENTVPAMVWLMPLKTLHFQAPEVVRKISVGLAGKAENAFEDVNQLKMRCNASLDDRVVQHLPQIQKKLINFQQLCNEYTSALQQNITKKSQSIKVGMTEESELEQLFEDRHSSPFNNEKLNRWMECMEREINVIRSCVEMMDGIQMVSDESELDRCVLAPGVEDAFCFVFTSVECEDPYIKALANYAASLKLGSAVDVSPCGQDQWFFSDQVLTRMREKAQDFQDLSKRRKNSRFCFLIAALTNDKYQGASIYYYHNGILITEDTSKPEQPPAEKTTDRSALLWYACDLTLDPNTVSNYLTLSDDNKKVTHAELQSYPDGPDRFVLPQVLCREPLIGRWYWEVEWGNRYREDIGVAVTYRAIERDTKTSSYLGLNDLSWSLGHKTKEKNVILYLEHDTETKEVPIPNDGFKRLGVFLDCFSHTLTYYRVSGSSVAALHTFTAEITEPLFAAFKIWTKGCYVKLL
ncbi:stonustoxin subunit alpha-like [Thalassophryne amazonica]|uniref:stonustoxin subunit alpha-like n=1 Tax=Thalassophryne amazonica TaxID=390379 RepID=UPI0014720FE3|nr:stonustoxin subunit alpha-like [Thalassophryne amazonica]